MNKTFKFSPIQLEIINLLETTKQPQTRGILVDTDGFCCLGLICNYLNIVYEISLRSSSKVYYGTNGTTSVLPSSVARKTGIQNTGEKLAELNDQYKLSFKQIAKRLKAYPHSYLIEQL